MSPMQFLGLRPTLTYAAPSAINLGGAVAGDEQKTFDELIEVSKILSRMHIVFHEHGTQMTRIGRIIADLMRECEGSEASEEFGPLTLTVKL